MNDRTRAAKVHAIAERAVWLDHELTTLLSLVRSAQEGQPGAAGYDAIGPGGPRTLLFCDEHDRELADCHRDERLVAEGVICTGRPLAVASDRTGEAAIHGDPARRDEQRLDRLIGHLDSTTRALVNLAARYRRRKATVDEARDTTAKADPGCSSCARTFVAKGVRRWSIVYVQDAREVGCAGAALCSWCYRFARDNGELPTVEQLEAHHAGKRVRLTPQQHANRDGVVGTPDGSPRPIGDGVDIDERLNPGRRRP